MYCVGLRVKGLGCRIQGLQLRLNGFGFRESHLSTSQKKHALFPRAVEIQASNPSVVLNVLQFHDAIPSFRSALGLSGYGFPKIAPEPREPQGTVDGGNSAPPC